jgi:hypothetical protein
MCRCLWWGGGARIDGPPRAGSARAAGRWGGSRCAPARRARRAADRGPRVFFGSSGANVSPGVTGCSTLRVALPAARCGSTPHAADAAAAVARRTAPGRRRPAPGWHGSISQGPVRALGAADAKPNALSELSLSAPRRRGPKFGVKLGGSYSCTHVTAVVQYSHTALQQCTRTEVLHFMYVNGCALGSIHVRVRSIHSIPAGTVAPQPPHRSPRSSTTRTGRGNVSS